MALVADMQRTRRAGLWRSILLASLGLLTVFSLELPLLGRMQRGAVHVLTIDGVINPLTARYLSRGLGQAVQANAELVVLEFNTPGGLETSMREMLEELLTPRVPVAVYVTPPGGRAASAGMFITMAGHVAAMAPGTNIGAAHPVGLGAQPDEVRQEKVVRDAAALARSIAVTRGRNAEWAEQAVLENVSITADEAVERHVVDFVAEHRDELLQWIDGRQVVTATGEVSVDTSDAPLIHLPMSVPERILHTMTDPNIAYLLFSLGMIGLIAELYNPGLLFPGIAGAISLIVAFAAFGPAAELGGARAAGARRGIVCRRAAERRHRHPRNRGGRGVRPRIVDAVRAVLSCVTGDARRAGQPLADRSDDGRDRRLLRVRRTRARARPSPTRRHGD
jgi:membrane-bound serine protease (ClpP class)